MKRLWYLNKTTISLQTILTLTLFSVERVVQHLNKGLTISLWYSGADDLHSEQNWQRLITLSTMISYNFFFCSSIDISDYIQSVTWFMTLGTIPWSTFIKDSIWPSSPVEALEVLFVFKKIYIDNISHFKYSVTATTWRIPHNWDPVRLFMKIRLNANNLVSPQTTQLPTFAAKILEKS